MNGRGLVAVVASVSICAGASLVTSGHRVSLTLLGVSAVLGVAVVAGMIAFAFGIASFEARWLPDGAGDRVVVDDRVLVEVELSRIRCHGTGRACRDGRCGVGVELAVIS